MNKNHYIVAKRRNKEGFTLVFGKVESVNGNILEGYVEKDVHIKGKSNTFEVPKKDVVVDLGPNPHPGSAYGFDVTNTFKGKRTHEFWGNINFFYTPEKDLQKKIMAAFDSAQKIVEKAGFTAPDAATWEILPKEAKGKWAGFYKRSKKPDAYPHRFGIKPESLPHSEFVYVILHEWAHHLHAENMTGTKLNAAWVRIFNSSIKVQTIKKDVSQTLLDALLSGEERPSDFKTGLDEEQRNAFNWIMRTIKAEHAVSPKELDILFEADYRDDIKAMWPVRTIHRKELAPTISEYATTNFYECIAEAVSMYLCKKKLPADVTRLVEKSLSFAKANQEKS